MYFWVTWCVIVRRSCLQATRILVSENALLAVAEGAFLMVDQHEYLCATFIPPSNHHDNVSLRLRFANFGRTALMRWSTNRGIRRICTHLVLA